MFTSAFKNFEFLPSNDDIMFVKYTPFSFNDFFIFLLCSSVVNVFAGVFPENASFKIASYFFELLFKYVLPSSCINFNL